ncbi:MAG: S-adenosylmethionine:tRNA ribosyltransferase-isomerase [Kofleriaceae bacterium]
MKFQRQTVREEPTALRPRGQSYTLQTREVPRHGVRLVVIDRARDRVSITPFHELPSLLNAGDLVVVNDAATLPASLFGTFGAQSIELRLSAPVDGSRLHGILFGAGDHHVRTEDRAAPPPIVPGDHLHFGALDTIVEAIAGRRVTLVAQLADDALWQAIYAAGKPIQYAHRPDLLPLYAVQTSYAARPWSVEMPSAGRALTWDVLLGLRRAGVELATLTHAAGLSSTGDEGLDHALPWPERYELPQVTIDKIGRAHRVIAIGTTVVRALESAGPDLQAGGGIATLRLDPAYRPKVVDALVSGLHVPGESHFELLSAFAPRPLLVRAIALAGQQGMSGHELGDACIVL